MTRNVCLIKIINGDEVIGEICKDTAKQLSILEPMVVEESINESTGRSTMLLTSYNPFEDDSLFVLSKQHVLAVIPVKDEIVRYYDNSRTFNKMFVTKKLESQIRDVNEQMEKQMEEYLFNNRESIKSKTVSLGHLNQGTKTIN